MGDEEWYFAILFSLALEFLEDGSKEETLKGPLILSFLVLLTLYCWNLRKICFLGCFKENTNFPLHTPSLVSYQPEQHVQCYFNVPQLNCR